MKKQLTVLFFLSLAIFSTHQTQAIWWSSSSSKPDFSAELEKEIDRICQPSEQDKVIVSEIERLKRDAVPAIVKDIEYWHTVYPFLNHAELLTSARSLLAASCLNFYCHLADALCRQQLQKNPPCSPEFMNIDSLEKGAYGYLCDKAIKVLYVDPRQGLPLGTLGTLLKNLDNDVKYAIHLAFKYGSPLGIIF